MPVINKYHFGCIPPHAINIMRGTPYGNPFVLGKDGTRDEVLRKFKIYLWKRLKEDTAFRKKVAALHGQTLCCCCKPKPCHGDVLLAASAWLWENSNHAWS